MTHTMSGQPSLLFFINFSILFEKIWSIMIFAKIPAALITFASTAARKGQMSAAFIKMYTDIKVGTACIY